MPTILRSGSFRLFLPMGRLRRTVCTRPTVESTSQGITPTKYRPRSRRYDLDRPARRFIRGSGKSDRSLNRWSFAKAGTSSFAGLECRHSTPLNLYRAFAVDGRRSPFSRRKLVSCIESEA